MQFLNIWNPRPLQSHAWQSHLWQSHPWQSHLWHWHSGLKYKKQVLVLGLATHLLMEIECLCLKTKYQKNGKCSSTLVYPSTTIRPSFSFVEVFHSMAFSALKIKSANKECWTTRRDNRIVRVKSISFNMSKQKVRHKGEKELSVIFFARVCVDCTAMGLVLMES